MLYGLAFHHSGRRFSVFEHICERGVFYSTSHIYPAGYYSLDSLLKLKDSRLTHKAVYALKTDVGYGESALTLDDMKALQRERAEKGLQDWPIEIIGFVDVKGN